MHCPPFELDIIKENEINMFGDSGLAAIIKDEDTAEFILRACNNYTFTREVLLHMTEALEAMACGEDTLSEEALEYLIQQARSALYLI